MTVRTTLPADAGSAAAARRFVADVLMQRGFPEAGIDDAVLLTSEAVTYAISLGRGTITLDVAAHPWISRVEVHLLDRSTPAAGGTAPDPPSGSAFLLIQALAEDWAAESGGADGRCIWFEVRA